MSALDGLRSAGKVLAEVVVRLRRIPSLKPEVSALHRVAVRPMQVVGFARAVVGLLPDRLVLAGGSDQAASRQAVVWV